jgi:hypothetical protein
VQGKEASGKPPGKHGDSPAFPDSGIIPESKNESFSIRVPSLSVRCLLPREVGSRIAGKSSLTYMSGIFRSAVLFGVFALLLHGAQAQSALAPVPAPLLSAQKVFLANGGADVVSTAAFRKAAEVNEPYNSMYNALQGWGHWQLVSSPDAADLVLVVRFGAPVAIYSKGMPLSDAPQEELTILDGKTHIPLWALAQPVQGAFRKTTWEKNYNDGIASLISELKALTAAPAPATP